MLSIDHPSQLVESAQLGISTAFTMDAAPVQQSQSEVSASSDIQTLTGEQETWSVYTKTRSTVQAQPLSRDELDKYTRYFHATMYLCLGMLYLKENPLLRAPLTKEHIKPRLLGHWGSDAGQSFT